jgi:hypothetical protein
MTTYMSSQLGAKAGQGRHVRRERLALRAFTVLAAFVVSAIALSGGMVLLSQAGLSIGAMAPAAALIFSAGVALMLMALVAGVRTD